RNALGAAIYQRQKETRWLSGAETKAHLAPFDYAQEAVMPQRNALGAAIYQRQKETRWLSGAEAKVSQSLS
ncbi:MAG: hypothetical protein ACWA5U_09500, partial [bacterium]